MGSFGVAELIDHTLLLSEPQILAVTNAGTVLQNEVGLVLVLQLPLFKTIKKGLILEPNRLRPPGAYTQFDTNKMAGKFTRFSEKRDVVVCFLFNNLNILCTYEILLKISDITTYDDAVDGIEPDESSGLHIPLPEVQEGI